MDITTRQLGRRSPLAQATDSGLVDWLLHLIRLYPFRCDICGHRFRRFSLRGREDRGGIRPGPGVVWLSAVPLNPGVTVPLTA